MSENQIKFSFTVNETSLSAIFFRVRSHADLITWSFDDFIPDALNKTYFVSVANGIDTKPFNFDLTIETKEKSEAPVIDVTLVSMKFDRQKDYTSEFKQLLNRVPDWAFAQDCIGAVTSYAY